MGHTPGFDRLRRLFAVAGWASANGIDAVDAEDAYDRMVIDRREMLRGMAGVAALAAMPPVLSGCASKPKVRPDQPLGARAVVAVVGGGIAGLHCTYRLRQAGVKATLYEAQNRTGGRMWTDRERFEGKLFEIGGELIDTTHTTMIALAKEFGITLDDRWAFEKPGMVRETWFVAGQRVTNEKLLEQTLAVAPTMAEQLAAAEADPKTFEMYSTMTLQAWLDQFVPVATYPELHTVLRVAFTGEYGLEATEQAALNLHYLFGIDSKEEFLIFGDSDERWHTHGGNDLITSALANAIGADGIQMGHKLIKAAGPTEGQYVLTFEGPAGLVEQRADHIVLALPFTLLRKVDLSGLTLSDQKRQIIAELGYGTNAKVMGEFSARPWWDQHNESGLLTTDLGVQQGWDTTIGQDVAEGGVWTNFLGGAAGANSGSGTAAQWFEGIVGDLETVWPGARAAWTGKAERMHWPTFQWSLGSYICYRPGQWAFWGNEGKREGNVHFCGEHCSLDFAGWMEGAAETGALVAAEVLDDLGLKPAVAHEQIVAPKLTVAQACYHGDVAPVPFQSRARRVTATAMAQAVAVR